MSGGIFLLRGGDELVPMTEAPYDTEDVLQELLAKFPDLLAGDQFAGADARRWILIERESAVPDAEEGMGRWSVDHVFLDQDGVPTLVEVKRSSDTRLRREVVGQLIDYAANAVVYWPVEKLRATFEARLEREGRDADAEIAAVLGPDADTDVYWEQAGANLKAGRIRLVFVADQIPRELRRVVEFLNEQMAAEVIAIEVKQYVGPDGLRTLVPRVIGQTAAAETRKQPREKRQWDEASFLAELDGRRGSAEVQVARELIAWARVALPRFTWGTGMLKGSFIPILEQAGRDYWPISLRTDGESHDRVQRSKRETAVRRRRAAPRISSPAQRDHRPVDPRRRDHASSAGPARRPCRQPGGARFLQGGARLVLRDRTIAR